MNVGALHPWFLLKNYVNVYNASKSKSSATSSLLTLFQRTDDGEIIFDMRPIESTILDLENLLKTKFFIDTKNDYTESEEYNLLGRSANPIEEFSLLIRSHGLPINNGGQESQNLQLKHLYKNAMLHIHPDIARDRADATAISKIIISYRINQFISFVRIFHIITEFI